MHNVLLLDCVDTKLFQAVRAESYSIKFGPGTSKYKNFIYVGLERKRNNTMITISRTSSSKYDSCYVARRLVTHFHDNSSGMSVLSFNHPTISSHSILGEGSDLSFMAGCSHYNGTMLHGTILIVMTSRQDWYFYCWSSNQRDSRF